MTEKSAMVLFRVNVNQNYRDLLLQHLSQLSLVHIKTKPEESVKFEKDDVLFERINKLSQSVESLFKNLDITESDFQKLSFKPDERKKFEVKDKNDLINQLVDEINYYSNRINELKSSRISIEIELEKINTIHGSYLFLEKYQLTRDKLMKFKVLEFKAFTTFAKNLENIENIFEFSHFPNFLHYDYLSNERIAFFIIYPKEYEEDFREKIRIIHAEEVPILKKYLLSDGINFPRIAKEIKFVITSLNKNQKELDRLRDDHLPLFAAAHEIVKNLEEYNWVSHQYEELSLNRSSLSFFLPKGKEKEIQQGLIDKFQDKITIDSIDITKHKIANLKEDKDHVYSGKLKDSKEETTTNGEPSSKEKEKEREKKDLRNSAPTVMRNNFLVRPFETVTKMYGVPAYSEIDPTPIIAITFPILFGLMFGDIGHGLVLIIAGLIGAIRYRNKKGKDFINFCWIILYCGIGAVIVGFLYGEFFGMNEIKLFSTVYMHLEPLTIPILNITLYNPLDNIMSVFKFAVLVGVFHLNLGWFIQFLNYWKLKRKFLGFTDSLIKIFLLTGGTILIFTYGFDIYAWLEPPYPLLLPLVPGILLIVLKPLGKIFRISYLKEESVGSLIGEGTMETFETLLSIMSNVASYIRLLALALAHISLMIAITAMGNLVQGTDIGSEIINIVGSIFGNMIVILLEGLLVFINAIRLHFYEFFFKFYQGSGVNYVPFYLDDTYSVIIFKVSSIKDVISEEIDKEIESEITQKDIIEAEKLVSKKYM
jgi:vacuolar-type H+-ATPase subunit I/STV1